MSWTRGRLRRGLRGGLRRREGSRRRWRRLQGNQLFSRIFFFKTFLELFPNLPKQLLESLKNFFFDFWGLVTCFRDLDFFYSKKLLLRICKKLDLLYLGAYTIFLPILTWSSRKARFFIQIPGYQIPFFYIYAMRSFFWKNLTNRSIVFWLFLSAYFPIFLEFFWLCKQFLL